MTQTAATARANSNIAFIKYWGNSDETLRLPANPSISMTLNGLYTQTTVRWDEGLASDTLTLNGRPASADELRRVSTHLDVIRQRLNLQTCAAVISDNNFPTGAGIASSASAFAALTLASVRAAGADLAERELSTLARLGSGSAARSIPAGFVEWHAGNDHLSSYAQSFAPPDHWDLVDVIAVISEDHKAVGSRQGHSAAATSDLQLARVAGAEERFTICRQAVLERDFATFADLVERDSNMMHAVMMTSRPALFYWLPTSLAVMLEVGRWRADGLNVCYTLDAGPNVHCICTADTADEVGRRLAQLDGVRNVLRAEPGGGAHVVTL